MMSGRAVATVGALKVVESMGMADLVDNPDVFTTLEKSTTGMVERVSCTLYRFLIANHTNSARLTLRPEKKPRASSCLLTARFCHGRFDRWTLIRSARFGDGQTFVSPLP